MIEISKKITYFQLLKEVKKIDFQLKSSEGQEAVENLLNNTVLYSGKRLRPLLVLIFCEIFEIEKNVALELARCIEFVHSSSLPMMM